MKAGKYVNHKFTTDQKKARMLWRRSNDEICKINDALMIITWGTTRKAMHDRLDRRLDTIERRQVHARDLFPDVEESFTIATMEIAL